MPRVLVVGPDTERTTTLCAALQEGGLTVDRVADAVDAVDAVDGRSYHCIVADGDTGDDLEAHLPDPGNGVNVVQARPAETPSELSDRVLDAADSRAFDRSLGRRRRLRELVADIRAALEEPTDRTDLERAVCRTLARSVDYDAAWMGRWNGSEISPGAAAGLERGSLRPVIPDADGTVAARAAVDWTVVSERDGPHVVLALPLVGEEPRGLLQVHAWRPGGVTAGERERLVGLTDTVADALEDTGEADESSPTDEEALQVLGDSLAHELGNQVDAARVQLELARERDDPEHFANVETALARIGSVADDARALAVESIEREDCDLTAVAEDAWTALETGDARLSVSPGSVDADPTLLGLLLENLFRNSIQHGTGDRSDGAGVTVTVEPIQDGAFAVADDGPGIPPDERDRVFDWGYSGSTGDGTGLGIVDLVADRHGWTVDLSESEDGGARFAFG